MYFTAFNRHIYSLEKTQCGFHPCHSVTLLVLSRSNTASGSGQQQAYIHLDTDTHSHDDTNVHRHMRFPWAPHRRGLLWANLHWTHRTLIYVGDWVTTWRGQYHWQKIFSTCIFWEEGASHIMQGHMRSYGVLARRQKGVRGRHWPEFLLDYLV